MLDDFVIAVRATFCVRRFGYSDVHVDRTSPGPYRCLGCSQQHGRDAIALSAAGMLGHLRRHWDRVPETVLTRLAFIAKEGK